MKAAAFLDFYFRFRQSGLFWKSAANIATPLPGQELPRRQKIVVVGIGVAAMTALEELHTLGFRNVEVIAEDSRFGGKCVHSGCMPSESFWLNSKNWRQSIDELGRLTEEKFKSWGYKLHADTAIEINEKRILLKSGAQVEFELLLLATGNRPINAYDFSNPVSAGEFWNLMGGHLVIINDGEPAAWSYADMALEMGLTCTLVQTRNSLVDHLPSFQTFTRQIRHRGVRFFPAATITSTSGEKNISFRSEGSFHQVPFDHIMTIGPTRLRLPKIDGRTPDVFALNLHSSRLKSRPDIFVLGEAGGLFSAAESELKALDTVWKMVGQNSPFGLESLAKLPLRLHAHRSWAATGGLHSFLNSTWDEVDFRLLGWTAVHGEDGKLWYSFDTGSKKIRAVHLVHRQAGELIALASTLLDLPVTDARWMTSFVHPSASEIFKYMALDIRRRYPQSFLEKRSISFPATLSLPSFAQLRQNPEIFNQQEIQRASLEREPWHYLALAYIARQEGHGVWPIYDESSGRYRFEGIADFSYEFAQDQIDAQWGPSRYRVFLR